MDIPSELLIPEKTLFKKDAALALGAEASVFGSKGMIVYGRSLESPDKLSGILGHLRPAMTAVRYCRAKSGEPELEEISAVIDDGRKHGVEWIAGIGGGSVLDLAKAAAGLFRAARPPAYYQEGGVLEERGIPFIAVPTTAGTGSEATTNSVIINPSKKTKLSIRDSSFLARRVILDAGLMEGIPPEIVAHAGMDALVQAYESYISKNASWLTRSLALKAVSLINEHLAGAYRTRGEDDLSALLLGSYLCGIAFSHSRLGVIHGVAHPIGALYHLPHGLICSLCLIPSIQINRKAMGERYDELSAAVGVDLLDRVAELLASLEITSPFKNLPVIEREKIIEETLASGSTAANPKKIKRDDVEQILGALFEQ
ncbi:MAG TPA: iron-containing alcohol dehydrogenase [bacterium]|nr:iron-containing alcohol dehydrogenase [bacterium]